MLNNRMAPRIGNTRCLLMAVLCSAIVLSDVYSMTISKRIVETFESIDDLTSAEISEYGVVSRTEGTVNREKREKRGFELGCQNCAEKKTLLSAQQKRQERIELTKQQIMQKLRMKSPPRPRSPKPDISPLLMATKMMNNETERDDERDAKEDFYGKTQNIVILSQNSRFSCSGSNGNPCSRFQYNLPSNIESTYVTSAELWLHKANATEELGITEFIFNEQEDLITDRKPLTTRTNESESNWVKFEVSQSIERWLYVSSFSLHPLTWDVEVTSEFDSEDEIVNLISLNEKEKPFLIIHTDSENMSTRNKRSVDCTESNATCCREAFYLSFSEIGWDNWIIHPDGYWANYCRGSCNNDISMTRSPHTNFVFDFITRHSSEAKDMGLTLCCTPSQLSSISFIYRDNDGLVFQKSLPNMVVESCDCA